MGTVLKTSNLAVYESKQVRCRTALERPVSADVVCGHVVCCELAGAEVPRVAPKTVADDARCSSGG